MKTGDTLLQSIVPGDFWAVTGPDPDVRSRWCAQIASDGEHANETALLNFAQHAAEAQKTGWPQARYYGADGCTVEEFLSFESVYDVNPFEVGVRYPETRAAYGRRAASIFRLLELQEIKTRPVMALSNGETRRVLLAHALMKRPNLLVLDDPAGGMDARQRAKIREIVASLVRKGLAIVFAYRHVDEVPDCVTRWLKIDAKGVAHDMAPPARPEMRKGRPANASAVRSKIASGQAAEPVVEICHLNVRLGRVRLFRNFSWTVRKGERWVLRGRNGSGKTTLFAMITGDSPLAYAADIKVFGLPRASGVELAKIRRRTGVVSPEMQAYLGLTPCELLDRALNPRYDLLLLDEPFMNLDARVARRESLRIERYLRAHKNVTAILICHRGDEAPRIFDRELDLDGTAD